MRKAMKGKKPKSIFIGFSKSRSHAAALMVRKLLIDVFGSKVRPVLSETDVIAGKPLMEQVKHLPATSNMGVICLTEENCYNPWLVGEMAALHSLGKPVFPLIVPPTEFAERLVFAVPFGDHAMRAGSDQFEDLVTQISRELKVKPRPGYTTANYVDELNGLKQSSSLAPLELRSFIDHVWEVNEELSPLNAVIRNQIVLHASLGLSELKPVRHADMLIFRDKVSEIVKQYENHHAVVLALCGHKGLAAGDIEPYFDQFFHLANRASGRWPTGPTLARVFVVDGNGYLHPEIEAPFQAHVNEPDYVAGVKVDKDGRSTLMQDFPGLLEHLDTGYGFVMFLDESGAGKLVTHAGTRDNFYMSEASNPLVLAGAFSVWRSFFNAAHPTPRQRMVLDHDVIKQLGRVR